MDLQLVSQAIQFHGPTFVQKLKPEIREQIFSTLSSDIEKHRRLHRSGEIVDVDFLDRVTEFITKKADILYQPVENDVHVQPDTTDIEDKYAIMPALESFMGVSLDVCKEHFFNSLEKRDVVIGVVTSLLESGLVVQLLCLDNNKARAIDDIKITAFCPVKELPRLVPGETAISAFHLKDTVRAAVLNVNQETRRIIISLQDKIFSSEDAIVPKLGLISEDDFPIYYKRTLHVRGLAFEELLHSIMGFNNSANITCLLDLHMLKEQTSLMHGLHNVNIPEKEFSENLRKWQSQKMAHSSVAQGVLMFKKGKILEAMQHLNKALQIDEKNVEALVARGALYANNESYSRAIEDFEEALLVNTRHVNARKYLYETLLVKGKADEEVGELDDAGGNYQKAVLLFPEKSDAQEALRLLHTKQDHLRRSMSRDSPGQKHSTPDSRKSSSHGGKKRKRSLNSLSPPHKRLRHSPDQLSQGLEDRLCHRKDKVKAYHWNVEAPGIKSESQDYSEKGGRSERISSEWGPESDHLRSEDQSSRFVKVEATRRIPLLENIHPESPGHLSHDVHKKRSPSMNLARRGSGFGGTQERRFSKSPFDVDEYLYGDLTVKEELFDESRAHESRTSSDKDRHSAACDQTSGHHLRKVEFDKGRNWTPMSPESKEKERTKRGSEHSLDKSIEAQKSQCEKHPGNEDDVASERTKHLGNEKSPRVSYSRYLHKEESKTHRSEYKERDGSSRKVVDEGSPHSPVDDSHKGNRFRKKSGNDNYQENTILEKSAESRINKINSSPHSERGRYRDGPNSERNRHSKGHRNKRRDEISSPHSERDEKDERNPSRDSWEGIRRDRTEENRYQKSKEGRIRDHSGEEKDRTRAVQKEKMDEDKHKNLFSQQSIEEWNEPRRFTISSIERTGNTSKRMLEESVRAIHQGSDDPVKHVRTVRPTFHRTIAEPALRMNTDHSHKQLLRGEAAESNPELVIPMRTGFVIPSKWDSPTEAAVFGEKGFRGKVNENIQIGFKCKGPDRMAGLNESSGEIFTAGSVGYSHHHKTVKSSSGSSSSSSGSSSSSSSSSSSDSESSSSDKSHSDSTSNRHYHHSSNTDHSVCKDVKSESVKDGDLKYGRRHEYYDDETRKLNLPDIIQSANRHGSQYIANDRREIEKTSMERMKRDGNVDKSKERVKSVVRMGGDSADSTPRKMAEPSKSYNKRSRSREGDQGRQQHRIVEGSRERRRSKPTYRGNSRSRQTACSTSRNRRSRERRLATNRSPSRDRSPVRNRSRSRERRRTINRSRSRERGRATNRRPSRDHSPVRDSSRSKQQHQSRSSRTVSGPRHNQSFHSDGHKNSGRKGDKQSLEGGRGTQDKCESSKSRRRSSSSSSSHSSTKISEVKSQVTETSSKVEVNIQKDDDEKKEEESKRRESLDDLENFLSTLKQNKKQQWIVEGKLKT